LRIEIFGKNLPRMRGEACGDGLCIRTMGKSLRVPAIIGWRNGCAANLAWVGDCRTGWAGNLGRLANWRRNSGQIATPGRIGQQAEVEDAVARLEKRPLPPVAPLR
jgi:hypothetical protein